MNFHLATTPDQALSIVREKLKTAQLNKSRTVIAATKGGEWTAVAYKATDGWKPATVAQMAQALPAAQFPEIPPTALEVYCKVRGWKGGTIHQAIADLKEQGAEFRDRLLSALPAAEWDSYGVDALLAA